MIKFFLCFALVFISILANAQVFSFDTIFKKKQILSSVNNNAEMYRLQIIYTQITRGNNNIPIFKNFTYKLDSTHYFYCASLVKLPCAILAIEKLNELEIDIDAIMYTDSGNTCQKSVKKDITALNGLPSIANYIKRMFLVSDNFSYSRVYEFLGINYLHSRLNNLGYKNIRIINRYNGTCKGTEHTITNPVSFYDTNLKLIYSQKMEFPKEHYTSPIGNIKLGKAYINAQNKKINEPKNFTQMNFMDLKNTHSILQRLVFNEYYPINNRYNLSLKHQQFLLNYLTLYPSESINPTYANNTFYDSYKKYFIYGDSKETITNTDLKITNIVGQSYGFTADCAYIQNKKENIEFMLSAVIYTNKDEILNDGKYEYNSIALPFLAELGRQIYDYELHRKK